MIAAFPASRFKRSGLTIYTNVERGENGLLGKNLTWRSAKGAMIWLGRHCRYLPIFFWRRLK